MCAALKVKFLFALLFYHARVKSCEQKYG